MQVPASNLYPNRFHRLVGNCRAEIDEELPLAILRSPWPKRVAQKIEFLVRIRPSPIIILAIDHLRLLRMKFQPTLLQACGYLGCVGHDTHCHRRDCSTIDRIDPLINVSPTLLETDMGVSCRS